ncbi:MAG: GAF domain-containing sensor histidine kinase [Aggregatilineales bacterium]
MTVSPSEKADRADTIDALQQRNRELSILNVIAESLNREIDLNRALHSTLEHVVELFHLRTAWIWLLYDPPRQSPDDDDEDGFYLAATLNLPPALANKPRRMEGWCHCREMYQAGAMSGAANVNVIQCSRLKGLIDGTDGLRYHASVPLYAHGKPLGILNVVSADWRKLSADDLRLLYTVGDLLSIAIERARLFARSTELGMVEERNRLAREIHDTLAQGLSATTLQLETADALLESSADVDHVRQAVQRALNLTRANLEEARRSVLDLRAAPLEGQTLAEAIPALAKELIGSTNLALKVELSGAVRPVPLRIEFGLYRIAQEAITNAIRHASARTLTIHIDLAPQAVELIVADDGIGFDSSRVPHRRFGLIGINERAHLLGGTAELCSAPGIGTTIRVRVPLDTPHAP